jgi:hypothetical protein
MEKKINRRAVLQHAGVGLVAGALGQTFFAPKAKAAPPAKLHAVWVHGNVVAVESPQNLKPDGIVRIGWGSSFVGKSGSTNWFHIPITTPVILDNVRPKLKKVFVKYKSMDGQITKLHIYDGGKKVKAFDGLKLMGDHSGALDDSNSWPSDPPLIIYSGLSISVAYKFDTLFDSTPPVPNLELLFTSAGADFEIV